MIEALRNLGITDNHLKASRDKQSRSSITGTYRILLHKIQKNSSTPVINIEGDEQDNSRSYRNSDKTDKRDAKNDVIPVATVSNKQSRFCVIL